MFSYGMDSTIIKPSHSMSAIDDTYIILLYFLLSKVNQNADITTKNTISYRYQKKFKYKLRDARKLPNMLTIGFCFLISF